MYIIIVYYTYFLTNKHILNVSVGICEEIASSSLFQVFLDSNGDSFSFDVQIDTMINNNYEICLLYIEYLVQTFTTFFKRYKEMVLFKKICKLKT